MEDKSKLTAVILVIITLTVVIVTFVLNNMKDDKKDNEVKIVTNYSNFYTVNSCLYRVITYISSSDKDSLILVLTDDYKKKNNVTVDNVIDIFDKVSDNSTFSSKKMYYENINDNVTKYYVYGTIEENLMYGDSLSKDAYFIVYLDTKSKVFEIEPYNGEVFFNGDANE